VKSIYLDGNPLYPVANSKSATLPSLRELTARLIKNCDIPFETLPGHLQDYLLSGKKCTHCSNYFYESFVRRGRFIVRGNDQFPIEYKLCSSHWTTEKERIKCMFQVKVVNQSSVQRSTSTNSIKSKEASSAVLTQKYVKVKRPFSFCFWKSF
jgi:hypothetical protein